MVATFSVAEPMSLDDYMALSGPEPSARIAYGAAPSQFVELFRPVGKGPFPVVVLVHGGCWTVAFGGIRQMHNVAGALQKQGIAVWNVEYRRVDETGGGYPGTYLDINGALQALEAQANKYQLDTTRIAAMGHSAGGQLVQWLAGRARIPKTSPLVPVDKLTIRHIISLGGLADLRTEKNLIKSRCGRDSIELTGSPSDARPDVYADTNAADLLPNGSITYLINGEYDQISPPRVAIDYAERARRAGDVAETLILPGAGHFDEIAASSPAWRLILPVVRKALQMPSSAK